jgi:hypothetical protein
VAQSVTGAGLKRVGWQTSGSGPFNYSKMNFKFL